MPVPARGILGESGQHPAGTLYPLDFNSFGFSWRFPGAAFILRPLRTGVRVWHPACYPLGQGVHPMVQLANPLFWNMKIKIAILTLATFAALC